jgi:Fur family transcriptional regulator, ferric uptake regulator
VTPPAVDEVLAALRARGMRITPQRRAIVAEVMHASGHISAPAIAGRVARRVPGVNPSTVYRTLALLEDIGVVAHAHLGTGAEYHRSGELDHVHLVCSSCGRVDSLSAAETDPLRALIEQHNAIVPEFTHFAIGGTCASCAEKERRTRAR